MKTPRRTRGTKLLAACTLLSFVAGRAYAAPTSSAPPTSQTRVGNDLRDFLPKNGPPLPSSSTSLSLNFAKSDKGDAMALLNAPVSFTLKGASPLGVLDTVLAQSGKTCNIECRSLQANKLSLSVSKVRAGSVLDGLAKAGRTRLYVFPAKLLLCPPELLTEKEKKEARLYGVFLTGSDATAKNADGKLTDKKGIIDIANTKISIDISGQELGDAFSSVSRSTHMPLSIEYRCTRDTLINSPGRQEISLSLQNINFGDALSIFADATGTEVFLLPKGFLLCAPDSLTPEEKKVAVSAFQPSSLNINFNDPSASNS